MDQYTTRLAAALRYLYESKGLSYTKISNQTGMSRATVVRVINGEREITVSYLEKLCKVFGVKPSAILGALEK